MPTVRESVCCKEITQLVQKTDDFEGEIDCVTDHTGFNSICLERWVLETNYMQYCQHYGHERQDATQNKWVYKNKYS